jgi:hypothetical protein
MLLKIGQTVLEDTYQHREFNGLAASVVDA